MLEKKLEARVKTRLENFGFKVLKLTTPGYTGTPDRMILWPKYDPRPPMFIEFKAPGQKARVLQIVVHADWRSRGVDVLPVVSNITECDELCEKLIDSLRIK